MSAAPKLSAADMEDFRRGLDEDDDVAWRRFAAKLDQVTGIDHSKLRPLTEPGW